VRRHGIVAVVASGIAVAGGLAIAPVAQAAGGASTLPHYLTNTLVSSKGRPSGYLGADVAISGRTVVADADGTTIGKVTDAGAVYVYTRSKSGKGRLTQRAVLSVPTEETYDDVGPVAVSGNTIVIGNEDATVGGQSDAGAAYVFEKPKSGWKSTSHPTARLTLAPAVDGDRIGTSVAIAGNTIAVGASELTVGVNSGQGAVLVYTKPAHGWTSSGTPAELTSATGAEDDALGYSVAISGDTIIAGAPDATVGGHDSAGNADVFVKPHSGGWATGTETRELDPKPPLIDLSFGTAVAISSRQVAVAAEGRTESSEFVHAAVFEFNEPAAGWGAGADPPLHPKARLTSAYNGPYDSYAQSIAISSSMIVAGAPYASIDRKFESGAVYIFNKPKKGWHNSTKPTQFIAANTERWDSFGYAVALSGSTIVVGAPYSDYTGIHNSDDRGTAYVFTKKHKAAK
jgi:hypothetical protein